MNLLIDQLPNMGYEPIKDPYNKISQIKFTVKIWVGANRADWKWLAGKIWVGIDRTDWKWLAGNIWVGIDRDDWKWPAGKI